MILNWWFADNDNDGFGGLDSIQSCQTVLQGWVLNHEDCDDQDAAINPLAEEILDNNVDENCDGNIELGVPYIRAEPLIVYPNPNRGDFVIASDDVFFYQILDQQGREVAQGILSKEKRVQLNTLSDGIYLFKSSKGVAPFVIQK